MKKIITLAIFISLFCFLSFNTHYTYAQYHEGELVTKVKPKVEFHDFTLDEIMKKYQVSDPNEIIQVAENKADGSSLIKFEGSAKDYLNKLSSSEKRLTSMGYSLKGVENVLDVYEIYTDPTKLRDELLLLLGAYVPKEFLGIIKDPIKQCSTLNLNKVIENIKGLKKESKITLLSGQTEPLENLINQINDHQIKFCSLGIDLLKTLNVPLDQSFFDVFFQQRKAFFEQYQLSGLESSFSFGSFDPIKDYNTISDEAQKLARKFENPGPEAMKLLKSELKINTIAKALDIPYFSELPKPIPAKHQELKLKKRKDWSGFNFGNVERFAAKASAYYEVRGSEQEQSSTGYGNADIFIFNNGINIISAAADFYASPREIYASIEFKCMGQSLYSKRVPSPGTVLPNISENRPDLFVQPLGKYEYSSVFTIAFIPVSVTAGAEGKLGFGYEYGLTLLSLYGKGNPWLKANAYATVAIGVAGVLSAGAGANLTILRVETPVSGEAKLIFLADGSPSLSLNVLGTVDYGALDGSIYGFIEYPFPCVDMCCKKIFGKKRCIPCGVDFVTKQEREILFTWRGEYNSYRILNWAITMGPQGTDLKGDLIDQTDREEAQKLGDAILLEEKAKLTVQYENDANRKFAEVFKNIANDLGSQENIDMMKMNSDVIAYNRYLEQNINNYFKDLENFIKN